MKIGILTFYRTENFGANLQALSTYKYLEKNGFEPIMIHYMSHEMHASLEKSKNLRAQVSAHFNFVDKYLPSQTQLCFNADDVNSVTELEGIEGVIIGSDAVVQHHPLLSRIHKGRFNPLIIQKVTPDRLFPNMFWGVGLDMHVKKVLMSVSCQNSEFKFLSLFLKRRMSKALRNFEYISARDLWTVKMFRSLGLKSIERTPDPVFAFNYNVGDIIPTKEEILKKFGLPEQYVLVSLMKQTLSMDCLQSLYHLFLKDGIECVTLPVPTGIGFKHPFRYSINEPLDPLDWYALIKYSSAYIGSNMHPIIVSLHNCVPCYSIDFWTNRNYFNKVVDDGSSKVEDILQQFDLQNYRSPILSTVCDVSPEMIYNAIKSFPRAKVKEISLLKYSQYKLMMNKIFEKLV